MKAQLSARDWELLSSYLDKQLPEKQAKDLEKRISQSIGLQNELKELERTRAILRQAPRRRPPRNFSITPNMVQSKPVGALFPVFSFASALAVVLLAVTFIVDWLPTVTSSPLADEKKENEMLSPQASATQSITQPAIIQWEGKTAPAFVPGLMEGAGGGTGPLRPTMPVQSFARESSEALQGKEPVPDQQIPAEALAVGEAAPPPALAEEMTIPAPSVPTEAPSSPTSHTAPTDEGHHLAQIPDMQATIDTNEFSPQPFPSSNGETQKEEEEKSASSTYSQPSSDQEDGHNIIIFGIRPTEEAGTIIATQGTLNPITKKSPFSPLPIFRIVLAIFALGAAITAFIVKRKSVQ